MPYIKSLWPISYIKSLISLALSTIINLVPSVGFPVSFPEKMASKTLISKLLPLTAAATRSQTLLRLPRPIIFAGDVLLRLHVITPASSLSLRRSFSSRPTQSSLNDPSPNWSNRPPKESILLDGCDFEHWLCVMEPPDASMTRDDIINHYIKTLAQVVGSEEEARMKIYSVSTKHYFAFGALVSEEVSHKIKALPGMRWVLPDSYLDVKNKDYGGEPFIDGQAVPYDPKYHEEWVRNNARANERSRRNDRPRNFDRSRNFERRSQPMPNQSAPQPMPNQSAPQPMQNQSAPQPMQNQSFQTNLNPNVPPQNAGALPMQNPNFNRSPQPPPQNSPPNVGGYPNQAPNPSYQSGGGGYQGGNPGYQQGGAPAYQQGNPVYQQGSAPPPYQQGNPGYQQGGAPPYQSGGNNYQPGYQNYQGGNSNPNPTNYQSGGGAYQGGNPGGYQGGAPFEPRDVPGRDKY